MPLTQPMRLLRFPEPFDHPQFIFEPKIEGFRALQFESLDVDFPSREFERAQAQESGARMARIGDPARGGERHSFQSPMLMAASNRPPLQQRFS